MKEGDHYVKRQKKKTNLLERLVANAGNVLPSIWIRFPFQAHDRPFWFFLEGGSCILLYIRVFLFMLYFALQIFKQI
jgi:hypothetical protein